VPEVRSSAEDVPVAAAAAFDSLPCGVIAFDDQGIVSAANAWLASMLGYEREEIIGRHLETILTIAGRIFFQTHLSPMLRLHGRAEELFVLLRRKDGGDVGALLNAVRQEREGHAVTYCVLMEVRERRKYEDALLRAKQTAEAARADVEHARQAAEEANRAKSEFLAVMSHELRTPLNAIGGYVQLLELEVHGPITDAQRDTLARVIRAQRHLLRLINDVLNLARIEARRVEYAIEPVNVAEVVASVMPMLEPQMASAGLTSSADVADLVVRADRDKMQQILINLLTNAVKFTPPGGTIRIVAHADRAAGRVRVGVSDTGIGIPRDKLASVFEPFVQVDASHTRRQQGSGLGLAISRDLARGMGGDLTAESEPGRGSTFILSLPSA
jgi:PAS domain S-box-containing protein